MIVNITPLTGNLKLNQAYPLINTNFQNLKTEVEKGGGLPKRKSFVATAGQTAFDISSVGSYTPGTSLILAFFGGVQQTSGVHFTETSPTVITAAEGLPVGTNVLIILFN
jgi:hypothetical protein